MPQGLKRILTTPHERILTTTLNVSASSFNTTTPNPSVHFSPPSSTFNESTRLDETTGLAIGSGLLFVVILLVLLVVYFKRQRHRNSNPELSDTTTSTQHVRTPATFDLPTRNTNSSWISFGSRISCFQQDHDSALAPWKHPSIQHARVSIRDLALDELIARGRTSEVYRGYLGEQLVAIKKPLPHWLRNPTNLTLLFKRLQVLASPSVAHPHLVSFLGVSWRSLAYVCLVSEFMAGGDLWSCLSIRRHTLNKHDPFQERGFGRTKLAIISHVASALSFLHTQGLVHGAVRSRNVLLDEGYHAKLTGYHGTWTHSIKYPMSAVANRKSCTMELSGPFLVSTKSCHQVSKFATNLPVGTRISKAMARLGATCVALDASKRPSATHVSAELHKLLQQFDR
ncbi:uncharacterized protein CCR75_001508 [Bremia lactucae]|uniref:Protein kinase domain-containing protein n=1 Tax=Bremia lactucae TaxID=4779 RepID=A0A976IC25_BRELC|nr:hypothetical protein CCR75_001508 [Bremia lactucae]